MKNNIRVMILSLLLSTSVNANIFYDAGNWIEGAWDSAWDWAGHNPGLAMVSSVAVVGVTEPILLSEAAMTVIAPVYGAWEGIASYVAESTFPRGAAEVASNEATLVLQMEVFTVESADAEMYVMTNDASAIMGDGALPSTDAYFQTSDSFFDDPVTHSDTYAVRNGEAVKLSAGEIRQILPRDPRQVAFYGGVLSALVLGSGYVGYNIIANGMDWSENNLNSAIIKINDGACWLANGAYDDCKNFLITELKIEDVDKNTTDNQSFFKQVVHVEEDFIIGNEELVFE